MGAFCRDCLTDTGDSARCPKCRSPRIARHPEIDTLTIAHVDCDAFYATIEKRDDPSLADKPLIVGGGQRGVVTTACYIARIFGVRSAMPMFEARRLCPQATIIKPNMAKYAEVSHQVRKLMFDLTPQVEPISIDEAFMDLSGTERLHGMSAAKSLARFAARVEKEIGITVSIGLAANKFLAKIASDLDKPRGFAVLGQAEAASFLADKPVGFIYGVGKVAAQKLTKDGFRLIADLQRADLVVVRDGGDGDGRGGANYSPKSGLVFREVFLEIRAVRHSSACRFVLLLGWIWLTALPLRAEEHRATRLGHPATRFALPLRTPEDLRARPARDFFFAGALAFFFAASISRRRAAAQPGLFT